MSIYSTVYVSTDEARDAIKRVIDTATNDELESLLFDMFASSTLNNYIVGGGNDVDYPMHEVDADSLINSRD